MAISNAHLNDNHEDKSGGGDILVPILTYNIFRRLKSTVMSAVCSVNVVSAFGMNVSSLKAASAAASNEGGMVNDDGEKNKGIGRRSRRKSLSGSSEAGKRINIEDIYNVHEKVSLIVFALYLDDVIVTVECWESLKNNSFLFFPIISHITIVG